MGRRKEPVEFVGRCFEHFISIHDIHETTRES